MLLHNQNQFKKLVSVFDGNKCPIKLAYKLCIQFVFSLKKQNNITLMYNVIKLFNQLIVQCISVELNRRKRVMHFF